MLLENARVAHARLKQADAARAGLEEAQALLTLNKDLSVKTSRFHDLVSRGALLRKYSVLLSNISDTASAKQAIVNVRSRFEESPKASTLKQGTRWTNLVAKLDAMINALEAQQNQDWKLYFSTRLFAGVPPEKRKETLLPSVNKEAIERYTKFYSQFIRYRSTIPGTKEALDDVHYCSDELGKIKFVENENVPASVKQFFAAVSTSAGASLELLTVEVIDWLRENKLLHSYMVRARF